MISKTLVVLAVLGLSQAQVLKTDPLGLRRGYAGGYAGGYNDRLGLGRGYVGGYNDRLGLQGRYLSNDRYVSGGGYLGYGAPGLRPGLLTPPAKAVIGAGPAPIALNAAVVGDDLAVPTPHQFNFNTVDEEGNQQSREETGDGFGNVQGSYTIADNKGLTRTVNYAADAVNGFTADIVTNEPGTDNQNPASVTIDAQPPPESAYIEQAPRPIGPIGPVALNNDRRLLDGRYGVGNLGGRYLDGRYGVGNVGGRYLDGRYGAGRYGAGRYGAGRYGAGRYGVGTYGAGRYGAGRYGAGTYGAGRYGTGLYDGRYNY